MSHKKLANVVAIIWPWILILVICMIFFYRLFFPTLSFFFTPDFGQSDIWHLNYPLKNYLAQSLKTGHIPIWTDKLASGYPIFAEGQMGVFNIFNIIAFRIFPPAWAFNLGYVFIFMFTWIGMLLFLRTQKTSKFWSFVGGFVFAFSGYFITHISHFNLIQTAAFLPWILYFVNRFLISRRIIYLLMFSFFSSQQLLSGFPQLWLISHITLAAYILIIWRNKPVKSNIKSYLLIGLFFAFALTLSAVQILPSSELINYSLRKGGLPYNEATRFPFSGKHLLTYFNPFLFGSPKSGTYPQFSESWGIFWENTAYIGILPIMFCLFSLIVIKYSRIKKFWLLIFLFILLIIGKNSPFYFIFTLPPFKFFRVPSRFLIGLNLVLVSLFVYMAMILEKKFFYRNYTKHIFRTSCALLILLDIFLTWNNYHPTVPIDALDKKPVIELSKQTKIYTLDLAWNREWNQSFLNYGWLNIKPYIDFQKALLANSNLINNIKSVNYYRSIATNWVNTQTSLIDNSLLINYQSRTATASSFFNPYLNLLGVNTIISPYSISNTKQYQLSKKLQTEHFPIYIYTNKEVNPDYYIPNQLIKVEVLSEFVKELVVWSASSQPLPVFWHEQTIPALNNPNLSVKKLISLPDYWSFKSQGEAGILVLKQSYYPAWQTYIDGEQTKLWRVNNNQMAVLIPAGNHLVEFRLLAKSFITGLIISLTSLIIWLIAVIYYSLSNFISAALSLAIQASKKSFAFLSS